MFSSPTKKRERTRLYPASYLKLGFVSDNADKKKSHCLLCCKSLCNDSMIDKKLEDHLKNVHSEQAEKPLEYFQSINKLRQKNQQMFLISIHAK